MFDKLKKAFGGSKEPKVEEKIEEALNNNEFVVYFQPKYSLREKKFISSEDEDEEFFDRYYNSLLQKKLPVEDLLKVSNVWTKEAQLSAVK